jgi:photosystem II stability/assembly factor-like uncharacterized protein
MVSIRKLTAILLFSILLVMAIAGCADAGNSSSTTTGTEAASNIPTATSVEPAGTPSGGVSTAIPDSPSPTNVSSSAPSSEEVALGKVTALRLANAKSGWAGGEGWIARTDDGGRSWKTQLKHNYIVNQLFALNDKQAWATFDIGDSKGVKLMSTADGGKKWTATGSVPNYGFLHFVSSKEAFSGNARTTDGGKSWVKLPVPDSLAGDPYFHDRSNGWAVIKGNNKFSISRTTDGGKTWRKTMTRATVATVMGVVIRSTGKNDAWVELIGESGMSQTSYSLFHTLNGGKSWIPVLAHSGAGSGPAPGYETGKETNVPSNKGAAPGTLYVVNPSVAFMGGQCMACDKPNTMGKTTDGGKTWIDLKGEFPGYDPQQVAAIDANHV